jgi:hypothetical protein
VDTAGPAEQRQYSVAHSLSRVASDIFLFMRPKRPGLYELVRARLCYPDWERFREGKYLTQSAQRHGEHGEKGDGLKLWCNADDLFERKDADWPGSVEQLFF